MPTNWKQSEFVGGSRDVFVNLQTAYTELLIYQALSSKFDSLTASPGHVVAVAWPLT